MCKGAPIHVQILYTMVLACRMYTGGIGSCVYNTNLSTNRNNDILNVSHTHTKKDTILFTV